MNNVLKYWKNSLVNSISNNHCKFKMINLIKLKVKSRKHNKNFNFLSNKKINKKLYCTFKGKIIL